MVVALMLVLSLICRQLLLQMFPHHVDSLLQLSDICRMQEDQEMAADLIGEKVKAAGGEGEGTGLLGLLSQF